MSKNSEVMILPADCCLRTLWPGFDFSSPFVWCSFWLWSIMMNPNFIYCFVPTQKILSIPRKQLQTALWILNWLLFLLHCEQTRHTLGTTFFLYPNCHAQFLTQCFLISLGYDLCPPAGHNDFSEFLMFSDAAISIGRRGRPASSVDVFEIRIPSENGCFRRALFIQFFSCNGILN